MSKNLKNKRYKVRDIKDLKEMLYNSAERYSKRAAFKIKDASGNIVKISYSKFKNDVVSLGTSLIKNGYLNKKILIIGKNSYEWSVSYMAAVIVGIVVPIDKELTVPEIINFSNLAEANLILGDEKYINQIIEEEINFKIKPSYVFLDNKNSNINIKNLQDHIEIGNTLLEKNDLSFDNIKINPDEMKILLFTSGTTGKSKGVSLSHRNICSNILSIRKIVKVHSRYLTLSILPLHHTFECTIGFLLILYSGATIAHCEGLKYINTNINEYMPTVVIGVPLLLESIQKKIITSLKKSLPKKYIERAKNDSEILKTLPFYLKPIVKSKINNSLGGRLRLLVVGAAAISGDVINTFNGLGLKIVQGYGLTECSPLVSANVNTKLKPNSVGNKIPDVGFKIFNPIEGVGEIIAKGPNVMLGYYNNEEATKEVMQDNWFHTGDLGKIDSDGYLYITGKKKNVIIAKNGKNIYPEEVEEKLHDNPLISEAVIIGIQKENGDEIYVNAQIFPNIDAIKEYLKTSIPTKEEISAIVKDIIKDVNSKLPIYKRIKDFDIREEEFEKTTTKKVKRFGNNTKKQKNTKGKS